MGVQLVTSKCELQMACAHSEEEPQYFAGQLGRQYTVQGCPQYGSTLVLPWAFESASLCSCSVIRRQRQVTGLLRLSATRAESALLDKTSSREALGDTPFCPPCCVVAVILCPFCLETEVPTARPLHRRLRSLLPCFLC